jgi:predicted O-methyltransferase YrrM
MTESSRWYPETIIAGDFGGRFDQTTIDFLNSSECQLPSESDASIEIAEIGCWKGGTTLKFAEFLNHSGKLHLFDYDDNVRSVALSLREKGFDNVETWGSSYKYLDSYNWSLMKLLQKSKLPRFDYVYLDGAHTWAIDALAFFLCDLLLKPGGYIDFDDYDWRLKDSSLDPAKVPETAAIYTEEQISTQQVKLVINLLVRNGQSYQEVVPNKIFRKTTS